MRIPAILTAFALGAGLALAFSPFAYGEVGVPRWACAWVGIAALLWLCEPLPQGALPVSGILFVALVLCSCLWAPGKLDAAGESFHVILLAGAFIVGAAGFGYYVFAGAGIGMAINAALAAAQFFDFHPVAEAPNVGPGALFVNRDFLAEACLLAVIPAVWYGRYVVASIIAPVFLIAQDRAVILAGACAAALGFWEADRKACAVAALTAGAILIVLLSIPHDKQNSVADRGGLWKDTIAGLTLSGRGAGQFQATYPEHAKFYDLERLRPDHAHNDWLEIAYEYGPLGLALAVAFACGVFLSSHGPERLVFVAYSIVACFSFPLHNPATAVLALLAAGACYRARALLRVRAPAFAMGAV